MITTILVAAGIGVVLGAGFGWKLGRGYERLRPTKTKAKADKPKKTTR